MTVAPALMITLVREPVPGPISKITSPSLISAISDS